ncbi:hypothetical protein [uncultured Algibacter sp.]|uniref:hypothetical protein n=1 Tax=uncultured Algibacter sp. TaxID=298659 RepID=UPI00262C490F|nr:hypothetical protein [uncultured Algibacter sp.]
MGVSQTPTTQKLALGSIGSEKDFLLQKDFSYSGLPAYSKPIKLEVKPVVFKKQSFKQFEKASQLQNSNVSIIYIDSLEQKPKYIELILADKIELVDAINSKKNKGIKNYLSHNKYANVLTHISVAFNQKHYGALTSADAVFLIEKNPKIYALSIYKNNTHKNILLDDGVVFQYSTSNCCWQEDSRRQLQIVDIVDNYSNCPNNTYKSSKRAKKKINYFKL